MKIPPPLSLLIILLFAERSSLLSIAQTLEYSTAPLLRESCISCHDDATTTALNLKAITFDLQSASNFRNWERIYSRITSGEMPPASEPRPDAKVLQTALDSLKNNLLSASMKKQRLQGRVPVRRLTRVEYNHTIRDLLKVQGEFSSSLPEETQAGSFDNVGSEQHFSAMHLESYLSAADVAIDAAIRLHKNPFREHQYDLLNSEFLNSFHNKDIQVGGNISRKLDDGVVIFRDVDYLLRSDLHGFRIRSNGSGTYHISIKAEAFQSTTPVAMKLVVKDISGQSELIQAYDLIPGTQHSLEANVYLQRSKVFYASMAEERSPAAILADIYDAGGAGNYKGAGVLVRSIEVKGPIESSWPPPSTTSLLAGTQCNPANDGAYTIECSEDPLLDVRNIVANLATQAFRRPLEDGELTAFTNLARPAIAKDMNFRDIIRLPVRAILSSPQFLFLSGEPGPLDDYALASRLSYFLWKSLPDAELLRLASRSELSRPEVLKTQVDRMLLDQRSGRFVTDFVGQWLGLKAINATTPDEKLYPEYDEILHWSVPQETEAFFTHLIANDLPIRYLVDSDFVFVNRRLAEHYNLAGVTGQTMRRVNLPADSVRGGLLTQASVLKVTANGLVTSPVNRGAFVLTDLLGTPSPPPPSNVGSIEPDTSGATTVRETLQRHRSVESCASCHNIIDPPGFALECFDPIGGYRTHYRKRFDDFLNFVKYEDGPKVDTETTAADGSPFNGLQDLKHSLLQQQYQMARHLVSQLAVYSTGGEIDFADQREIEAIVERTTAAGFPLKTLIHQVVNSKLFLNR